MTKFINIKLKINFKQNLENFNCLSASNEENNEFIFVGGNGFLASIDVDAMKLIDKVEVTDDFLLIQSTKAVSKTEMTQSITSIIQTQPTNLNTNIVSIQSGFLKSMTYLVVSITDAGYIIMHLFVESKFYPIYFDLMVSINIWSF